MAIHAVQAGHAVHYALWQLPVVAVALGPVAPRPHTQAHAHGRLRSVQKTVDSLAKSVAAQRAVCTCPLQFCSVQPTAHS